MSKYLATIAAAAMLMACGQASESKAQTTVNAAAPGKPMASAPAAEAAGALTPAMLVGRWGDNGDCAKDIIFAPDGTFRSYTGGSGAWSLNGNVMTMSGSGGVFQVRVDVINGQRLLVTNPDGSIGTSQRC